MNTLFEAKQPYTCPVAFLPAASVLPTAVSSHPLLAAMQAIIAQTDKLGGAWQQAAVTPAQVARQCADVSATLAPVTALLQTEGAPLYAQVADGQTLDAQEIARQAFSPIMAEACAIYDRYFQVQRVHPMTFGQFVGQVAQTCLALLDDLPYTLLDRAQYTQLIANIQQMLATLAGRMPPRAAAPAAQALSPDAQAQPAGNDSLTFSAWWQADEAFSPAWQAQVAHYRWKVGHHFFNLCAIFCGDALRCALDASEADNVDGAAQQLHQAEQFLRGTTAAMWYAGDYPAQLYRQLIRPSMVMPGASAGFSGDQNADYNRMKLAKQQLKHRLRTCYGPELTHMPATLQRAFRNFHEADIEDNEHHLLIAAHKVGLDQSLAQKEWQAELPAYAPKQTALDILREMAEMKRKEFAP